MRRAAVMVVTVLVLTLMMVVSTGVAAASWGWEDTASTPPKATKVQKPPKATGSVGAHLWYAHGK